MQIVTTGDNIHEMSNLISCEKCGLLKILPNVLSIKCYLAILKWGANQR